jgi:4-carboxymuconolactone decarboxylase
MTEQRFQLLTDDQLTPEQKQALTALWATPRDGKLGLGPFNALLRSPELLNRAQRLGEYVRFQSSLPPRLNELAILITARHWTAQYEWFAHHRLALTAGLDPAIAAAIAEGKRPANMQSDETVVYEFCAELIATGQVSDAHFQAARDLFGEQGVIDLVGALGYYSLIAMVLNVDRCPVPDGQLAPLALLEEKTSQVSKNL